MRKRKAESLWRDFLLERFSRKGLFSRPVVPEFEWGIYGESTGKVRGGGSSWDGAVPCHAVYIAYVFLPLSAAGRLSLLVPILQTAMLLGHAVGG